MIAEFKIPPHSTNFDLFNKKLQAWFKLDLSDIPDILRSIGIEGTICYIGEAREEKVGVDFARLLIEIPSPVIQTYILEIRHSRYNDFEAEFALYSTSKTIVFSPEKKFVINNFRENFANPEIKRQINKITGYSKK